MQSVLQLAQQFPDMFDRRAVVARIMKQLKIANANELTPNAAQPEEMNAADENAAMSLGKPAFAYPRQDQLAHINTHIAFALDPSLGMNPIIAPVYIPQVLEHIKQHMMLWYQGRMNGYVTHGTSLDISNYEESKIPHKIDEAMALASEHMKMDTAQVFQKLLPMIQQLMQVAQQFKPQPPMDPESQAILQASMAETQRRAARDQADTQINMAKMQQAAQQEQQKLQTEVAMNAENNLTQERMKTAQLTVDEVKLQREQEETAIKLNEEAQRNLGANHGNYPER
jgi:hypothetical protein